MPTDSRTVVVCVPAGTHLDWFSASEILDWHQLPPGVPHPMFPVHRPWITGWATRWSARHLHHPVRRCGTVRHAAGGHRARLDLPAAAGTANTAAVDRWQIWNQVVRGTPAARPWPDFHAQHTSQPGKVSLDEARRRFDNQPRVLAMLGYSSHPHARHQLDPGEVDAYQAGQGTYAVLHWQHAITGDALITDDGRLLQPAGTSLADRLRYHAEACAYLIRLPRRAQVMALTVADHP